MEQSDGKFCPQHSWRFGLVPDGHGGHCSRVVPPCTWQEIVDITRYEDITVCLWVVNSLWDAESLRSASLVGSDQSFIIALGLVFSDVFRWLYEMDNSAILKWGKGY